MALFTMQNFPNVEVATSFTNYNETLTLLGSAFPTTFSPVGLSSMYIQNIWLSAASAGGESPLGWSLSTHNVLPFQVLISGTPTYGSTALLSVRGAGGNAILPFTISIANSTTHEDDFERKYVVAVSAFGVAVSSGITGATFQSGTWASSVFTMSAYSGWLSWDSQYDHARLYEQGQI